MSAERAPEINNEAVLEQQAKVFYLPLEDHKDEEYYPQPSQEKLEFMVGELMGFEPDEAAFALLSITKKLKCFVANEQLIAIDQGYGDEKDREMWLSLYRRNFDEKFDYSDCRNI